MGKYSRPMRDDLKYKVIRMYLETGMSQYQISQKIGISPSSVSYYVTGWNTNHFGADADDLEYCAKEIRRMDK